jgi:uncharacterized membrane protein YbhN (UPF0104 family)
MDRRRLLQTLILVVGLGAMTLVVVRTVDDAQEQVLPSVPAMVVAGLLALVAIISSARAWAALFSEFLSTRARHVVLRGTFYLAQLTKYLPVGGIVQAASQLGLAPTAGVPVRRAAIAFPVTVLGAVAACGTLGAGLVFSTDLPPWIRALALLGLALPAVLHRGAMAKVLELGRRFVHRIPSPDNLPTQRDIIAFYGWALVTNGALCAAFAILMGSVVDVNPLSVFSAYAVSWAIGFLAVPIPAGVGVREAVLVALLPGIGAAPILAASLVLRLLSIGAELLALCGNRLVRRGVTDPLKEEANPRQLRTS